MFLVLFQDSAAACSPMSTCDDLITGVGDSGLIDTQLGPGPTALHRLLTLVDMRVGTVQCNQINSVLELWPGR